MVPPSSKKVFVLDTNVLLHDPNSILHFQEHDVVLPIVVIEEVDHFKKDQTEVGRNARTVSRMLDRLRANGSLSRGVPLESGGSLKVDVAPHSLDLGILSADKNKADNQILACALELLKSCKERVVLVSKDTNLRIKADAIGVQAEDYTTDRVEMDELYTGHKSWEVDPARWTCSMMAASSRIPRCILNPTSSSLWWTRPIPATRPWPASWSGRGSCGP